MGVGARHGARVGERLTSSTPCPLHHRRSSRCPQLGPTYPPYAPPRSTRAAPSFLPSFSPRPPPPPRPPPAPRRRPPLTTRPLPSSPRIFSLSLFLFRPASLWTSFSFSRYITVQISIPETHRPVGGDADPSCLRAVSLTRARIFGDPFFFLFLFLSLFLFDIRESFVPIFSTIAQITLRFSRYVSVKKIVTLFRIFNERIVSRIALWREIAFCNNWVRS